MSGLNSTLPLPSRAVHDLAPISISADVAPALTLDELEAALEALAPYDLRALHAALLAASSRVAFARRYDVALVLITMVVETIASTRTDQAGLV